MATQSDSAAPAGDAGLPARIVAALRSVVPGPASLHEPVFAGREWDYVQDCITTGIVSSVGPYVDRLEAMLARLAGVKRAVATVNGTAALHVCLQLAGVKRDDEVLIPALTFIATANAVAYCGAIPHLVEHARASLGICPESLAGYLARAVDVRADGHAWNRATGRRISACVPMHTFGHPVDLDPLLEVCARFNIVVVEDAAESLGSTYKGKATGSLGRISALSFNGNKIVTTGGGGAILTDDEELGALAKHVTTTAKVPHKWEYFHDRIGYNYRMPNLNAALGCAQLEQLDGFIARKRALADRYRKAFVGIEGVRFFSEPANTRSNYWLNALIFEPSQRGQREATLAATHAVGLLTRPAWVLMSNLPMYSACPKMDLTVAEELEACILNIPSGAGLQTP
jgi:perosamine synthetase